MIICGDLLSKCFLPDLRFFVQKNGRFPVSADFNDDFRMWKIGGKGRSFRFFDKRRVGTIKMLVGNLSAGMKRFLLTVKKTLIDASYWRSWDSDFDRSDAKYALSYSRYRTKRKSKPCCFSHFLGLILIWAY